MGEGSTGMFLSVLLHQGSGMPWMLGPPNWTRTKFFFSFHRSNWAARSYCVPLEIQYGHESISSVEGEPQVTAARDLWLQLSSSLLDCEGEVRPSFLGGYEFPFSLSLEQLWVKENAEQTWENGLGLCTLCLQEECPNHLLAVIFLAAFSLSVSVALACPATLWLSFKRDKEECSSSPAYPVIWWLEHFLESEWA